MAIILDERARAAVARRRTRGWDTTLFLRHEVLPVGRGDTLAVGWKCGKPETSRWSWTGGSPSTRGGTT
jgi:hypothetical protein